MYNDILNSITDFTLGNGLKVLCVQKKDAPIISVQVWYKTGSCNEQSGIHGISHMLEHMMFRGSAHVASEEHARRINDVGGHCNAFTTEDVTAYVNSVPRHYLQMVLELEADRMANLTLSKDLFETERKVIQEEYHTYMNNPVAKAFLEFRSLFFKNQPYEISPLGRIEDIQSISIEAMRSYYSSWYSPGTAIIIIVGDFDSAGLVAELVEKYFGAITSTNEKSVHHFFNGPTAGSHWMKRKVDFDVPILLIGYPAPASSSDDVLPLEIIQTILSQGETSRIHKELVRKKSVAVMAGGINHFLKHAGMSLFFAAFTPDTRCKNVESALNKQIELIKTHGISESEMQKVKNISLTSRTFELFSAESICHHLGYAETVDGSFTAWVRRLETLEKLHRDQIIEAAIKYWKDDMRHTLYLQPKKINPLLFLMGLVRRVIPG